MFSSRSTLGKIENTLKISEALEEVCTNAIFNHNYAQVINNGYVNKLLFTGTETLPEL